MLPCRPQHFPGGQKCFLEGKRSIWVARQVLWPAWEHCWVVRFPSRNGFSVSAVKKTFKKHCFLQWMQRLWQNRRLHRQFYSFGQHQSTTLRKWCSRAGQKQVLAPHGPETAIEGSYAAGAVLQRLRCTGYAAGAMLHELCCKDYAAGTLLQAQCCKGYHAGHTAAAMPHLLCCTCSAAGAMLQGLCCKGYAAGAMATQINMLGMNCCSTLQRWSAHNAVAF